MSRGAAEDPSYWSKRWETDDTPWRISEREELPFHTNFLDIIRFVSGGFHTSGESTSEDAFLRQFYHGAKVLVPLCGDSLVFSALSRLGCDVVGVDLADVSIQKAIQEQFPECTDFAPSTEGIQWDGASIDLKKYVIQPKGQNNTVTLFAGDFFAFCALPQYQHYFDFVYDRASIVALPPELRPKYAASLKRVIRKPVPFRSRESTSSKDSRKPEGLLTLPHIGPVMCVIAVERRKDNQAAGPPFHVPPEELVTLYPPMEGFQWQLLRHTREAFDDPSQSNVRFVDAVYGCRLSRPLSLGRSNI